MSIPKHGFAIFFLMANLALNAQIPYFNLKFDYQNRLEFSGLNAIEDESYYLVPVGVARITSNMADSSFILKIDKSTGTIELDPVNNYSGQTSGTITLSNGKYMVEGQHFPNNSGEVNATDAFFCHYDPITGESSNFTSFGWPDRGEYPYVPIATSDGGFFTTGWTFPITGPVQHALVYRCDSNLQQQYLRRYPETNAVGSYFGDNAVELPSGDIMCVGTHRVGQGADRRDHALVFRVKPDGSLRWWKEHNSVSDTMERIIYDIKPKGDGTFIAVGYCEVGPPVGMRTSYAWAIGLNDDGEILWQKFHNPNNQSLWGDVIASPDGNFYACGGERDYITFDNQNNIQYLQYGTVSKLSPTGDLLWHRRYTVEVPNAHYDEFDYVLPTSDGGLLCIGVTFSGDSTYQDAWIIKLDDKGCLEPGCDSLSSTVLLPMGAGQPFTIAPNPSHGLFRLMAKDLSAPITNAQVLALNGQTVWQQQGGEATELLLDLTARPAGTYILTFMQGGVLYGRQLVVINY